MPSLINSRRSMASSLRGPDRAERDCTRCLLRKQTCDRKLPHCTRCLAYDPTRKIHCQFVPILTCSTAQDPQPRGPFLKLSNKQWRMTDQGREQLGKLLLSDADAFNGVPYGIKTFVETLLSDCGRTIDELLQDSIFKWFPIVEPGYMDKYVSLDQSSFYDRDPERFLPLLHMAILLATSPPAVVYSVFGTMDGIMVHTDLYKATKALFSVVSAHTKAHAHLVQTLGLISLYEFGIGSFEQAHITLNSALAMATMARDYRLDTDAVLTWQLCLMTLDSMIALSTHSRICNILPSDCPNRLPLICDRNHPLTRQVERLLDDYNHPQCPRNSEEAIQRLLALNEGVARARRILQYDNMNQDDLIHDGDYDYDLEDYLIQKLESRRAGVLEQEKRAMMDDNSKPKAPDYWSGHDPQVLSLSAMLVREYQERSAKDQRHTAQYLDWLGKCEDVALEACTNVVTMSTQKEIDIKQLSMVSMFCIMHNLAIILKKNSESEEALRKAVEFKAVLCKFAVRWPFAQVYLDHLTRFIITAEDRQGVHYDDQGRLEVAETRHYEFEIE